MSNRSIEFFDDKFRHQERELALRFNPFEEVVLPYLYGEVLDFGCGMGNLAFAAAERGCRITALDGSPVAIEHIQARAAREKASVSASLSDLRDFEIDGLYDCVVSIGLLMFFDCDHAHRALASLQSHVRPGGLMALNVLVEGTSYFDMFDPDAFCLFESNSLHSRFAHWEIEFFETAEFAAPGDLVKRFSTIVARKPKA